MYGVIYKWENLINGKVYIGKTISPKSRYNRHIYYVNNGTGYALHAAIRKYGIDNFTYEIICSAYKESYLAELEVILISQFDSFNSGYNLNPGGEGMKGYRHTEETKEKMRIAKIGKSLSEEHKQKIGKSGIGKILSEETRKKMSESSKGKKKSEQHIRNMSLSNKGKSVPEHIRLLGVAAFKLKMQKRREQELKETHELLV